ncbi:MAG: response regulator [Deltaproteobacteria bacterium]|nr:response regulator [Deltaproteobacteria bacterium]
MLSRIATRFLGLASAEVDGAVCTAIGELGEYMGAARVHVLVLRLGSRVGDITHQWCATDIESTRARLQGVDLDRFGAVGDAVLGTEVLHIRSLGDLPQSAQVVAKALMVDGARSILGVPMSHGTALRGFMAMTFGETTEPWPDETLTLLRMAAHAIAGALATKRSEEVLREREAQLRTVVESLPFDCFAIGMNGRYTMQNSACRAHWGDVVGKRPAEVAPSPAIRALWEDNNRRAFAGELVSGEVTLEAQGQQRQFHNIISPIMDGGTQRGILGVNIDVTEQRRAEQGKVEVEDQLRRMQKLEAVGTLAGGVAHDFNNLLVGMLGHAQLIQRRCEPGTAIAESAQVIDQTATRAAELTGQLLAFARRGKRREVPVDVHQIVAEAVAILGPTVARRVTIEQRLEAHAHTCLGDPGQLQQVVMNLAVNACDAMPDGGSLTFATEEMTLAGGDSAMGPEVGPGRHLVLSVTDTGTGISEEVHARLFEPFFTTKPVGQGSGMGLATAYGIVGSHGGWLELADGTSGRTTFQVGLPLTDRPAEPANGLEGRVLVRGSGHILVVDDEAAVRETVTAMLVDLGYEVTAVGDGSQAIEAYGTRGAAFDLVILDLTMPGMDGGECLQGLKAINPSVPVVVSTGKAVERDSEQWTALGLRGLLLKPFRMEELSKVVATAMARRPA